MTFKFLVAQSQASLFYTNRTEAFMELVSTEKLAVTIIEGGGLKKDVLPAAMETRVANMRIPAGHWLVLSRENAEQELEVHLRRIADGSGVLTALTEIVANEKFSALPGEPVGLVKNELVRSMSYRLIVRADKVDPDVVLHVVSGADTIIPLSGSFIVDTVVPSGGILAIKTEGGTYTGHYDLLVDP